MTKYITTAVIIALIIVAGYFLIFNKNIKVQNRQTNQANLNNINNEFGNLPPLGNPNAKVKIIEFADFLCPFCARAVIDLYPQLEPLINQSEVVVYFRDFIVHPQAMPIHNAARCANEQGKFWEFNKEIFKKYLNGENITQKEVWQNLAQSLGLDLEKFNNCVGSNKYIQDVQNDSQYSYSLGLEGTPTFFINGQRVVGLDIPQIQSILNSLLK